MNTSNTRLPPAAADGKHRCAAERDRLQILPRKRKERLIRNFESAEAAPHHHDRIPSRRRSSPP